MINILFENNDFVVCIKPVGIASQNDKTQDMVKLLTKQLSSTIFPVHRLDTAVGGTMVFAKNQISAITSTSTRTFFGSCFAATHDLAGLDVS